jgi:predicted transcriptional regulator
MRRHATRLSRLSLPCDAADTLPSEGENIRDILYAPTCPRKEQGLTQTELGESVDVSCRVIAYYEGETHNPLTFNQLSSFSSILHAPPLGRSPE